MYCVFSIRIREAYTLGGKGGGEGKIIECKSISGEKQAIKPGDAWAGGREGKVGYKDAYTY